MGASHSGLGEVDFVPHWRKGNYDESPIPLRGMLVGRNGAVVGYTAGEHADKLRPCKHWCGKQPVDETGSGQT
jgi:homoserine acetyltransferase